MGKPSSNSKAFAEKLEPKKNPFSQRHRLKSNKSHSNIGKPKRCASEFDNQAQKGKNAKDPKARRSVLVSPKRDSKSVENELIIPLEHWRNRPKEFHPEQPLVFRRSNKVAWNCLRELIEEVKNKNRDIKRKDSACQEMKWVWTVRIMDFWHMNDFFNKTHYFTSLLTKSQHEFFQESHLNEWHEAPLLNHVPVFLDFTTKLLNLLFRNFQFRQRLRFWENPWISSDLIRNFVRIRGHDFQMSLHLYVLEIFLNFMHLADCVYSAEKTACTRLIPIKSFNPLSCKSFLIALHEVT